MGLDDTLKINKIKILCDRSIIIYNLVYIMIKVSLKIKSLSKLQI